MSAYPVTTNPAAERASTAQRDYINRLLRQAEYDTRTVSLPHRSLAKRAYLPVLPENGTSVDTWVNALTKPSASRLITALRRETGDSDQ